MAEQIFDTGHIQMLENAGVKLEGNNESGVLKALKENASAVFHALEQQIGNTQISVSFDMADMFSGNPDKADKFQRYVDMIGRQISTMKQLKRLSEKAIEVAGNGSNEQNLLQAKIDYIGQNMAQWEAKYQELS